MQLIQSFAVYCREVDETLGIASSVSANSLYELLESNQRVYDAHWDKLETVYYEGDIAGYRIKMDLVELDMLGLNPENLGVVDKIDSAIEELHTHATVGLARYREHLTAGHSFVHVSETSNLDGFLRVYERMARSERDLDTEVFPMAVMALEGHVFVSMIDEYLSVAASDHPAREKLLDYYRAMAAMLGDEEYEKAAFARDLKNDLL